MSLFCFAYWWRIVQRMNRSRGGSHRRRRSSAVVSQKLQMTECNLGGLHTLSTTSFMEVN